MCKALLCLCVRKRDFCGSDVLRRSHFFVWRVPPCGAGSFLFAQKGTKNALGAASGEHLACGGAHSHCPQTPNYGSGSLWVFGKFRRAKSRSVSLLFPGLRPFCHQNLQAFTLYRTPPGACLPVWCGRHRLPSCPGSARLGGVRTAQRFSNF